MVILKKGDITPFKGVLVDAKQMSEFRKYKELSKLQGKQILKLEDLAVVKDRKADLYKGEADHYRTLYRRQQFKTFWASAGYFALGVLATGFAAKAALESTK